MTGYVGQIEKRTLSNNSFRRVLFTGKHSQLVIMCLQPGEQTGNELYPDVDQLFRIEDGQAFFVFNGNERHRVQEGDAIAVPAGTFHNLVNASNVTKLRLYAICSPPNYPDRAVQETKADSISVGRRFLKS